jgi:phasin family protein
MADVKTMAEQAKKLGQEYQKQIDQTAREFQEQATTAGEEYQKAAAKGLEVASRSAAEINKGFQSIAAELTDYSKRTLEDLFQTWDELLRARSAGDVIEVQTRYAKKAYETHMSKMSRLAKLYADLTRNASKKSD